MARKTKDVLERARDTEVQNQNRPRIKRIGILDAK